MLTAACTHRFARRAELAAPELCRPTTAPAGPAVEVIVCRAVGETVLRVKGDAKFEAAGALFDGLMLPVMCQPAVITLDLGGLRSISALAMGALVCYRRSVVRAGGRVRLAGTLQPAVYEALSRAGLLDLFEAAGAPARV
jgi:anti-anti-sigma regulatory factor